MLDRVSTSYQTNSEVLITMASTISEDSLKKHSAKVSGIRVIRIGLSKLNDGSKTRTAREAGLFTPFGKT